MATIRLDKFLSSQLQISRADTKKLIRSGAVTLAPARPAEAELKIDPDVDAVFVSGRRIAYKAHTYIMLNKPAGYVSSTQDRAPTVLELVPPALYRPGLFPAGRLDKDTTGFLLLTDDGDFAHRMLSPARHVEKEYEVTLRRPVTDEERRQIETGMRLGDELLKPAALSFLRESPDGPVYAIVLTQGRYHQIKRMFGAQKNAVTALKRVRMGGLPLDPALAPGACRELSEAEIASVFE